ncbi:MAG: TSUP family transporter [Alphaproteobacteria bacterium]
MESQFLGMPDVSGWLFVGLAAASFCTTFLGIVTGTAGGLLLLLILAVFFPPVVLIPLHTLVQLGAGLGRVALMRRYVLKQTMLPFFVGSAIGAAAGAQIFMTLPTGLLQGIIAIFVIFAIWVPSIGKMGTERNRFALVGFGATFLGVFVSATGTLVAPFIASASQDRRNYVATFAALMSLVHISKVAAFAVLGVAIGTYAPLIVAMIATAMLANWTGRMVLDRMPERAFRTVLRIVLTLLALRLLWVAASEANIL